MAEIAQPSAVSALSGGAAALPVSEAVQHAVSAACAEIDAIIKHREEHHRPVLRMDKSLINTSPPAAALDLIEGRKQSKYSSWEVGPAQGVIELRQEIANWRRNLYQERITSDNVLITPGASAAFFLTLCSLVHPGEGVITMTPCFPNYMGALRIRGAEVSKVRLLAENDFAPAFNQLMSCWGPRTKLAVCTQPNNPTATMLDSASIKGIEGLASDRGGRVLIDETFAQFDLRPDAQPLHNLSLKTTITIGSFSEAFSLADLRVGYIIAPAELVRDMSILQGYVNVGASARAQEVAFAALRGREEHLSRLVPKLRQRDADLTDLLTHIPGVEDVVGYAGTFKWVKTGNTDSARLAVDLARETGVIVRPGVDYGQDGWIRIAFGMIAGDSTFRDAMQRLCAFKGWAKTSEWSEELAPPRRPRVARTSLPAGPSV